MAELKEEFGSLSHPCLELSTTAPLVGDWAGVCLNHFLPSPRTPLSAHFSSVTLCSAAFPCGGAGKPSERNLPEDNVQKFILQSSHLTDIVFFFLHT